MMNFISLISKYTNRFKMGKQKLPQTFQFPGYNYNTCTISVLELIWILPLVWTKFFFPKIKKKRVLFLSVLVYYTIEIPTKVETHVCPRASHIWVDNQAMSSHQFCEEEPDLPMCYLFIILYL